MTYLYTLLIKNPLLNALIFLYNTVAFHDLGIAIMLLTLLIRVILFPIFHRAARHQSVMQEIQPKLKKIQEDHKHDQEKQTHAMMELYKEHNINPFAGFGYLLIQLPILLGIYWIFRNIFHPDALLGLYSFVHAPASLNASFLGLINLQNRSIVVVGLAALFQYIQTKMSVPKRAEGHEPSAAERATERMALIGPAMTLAIFWNFPAAIGLYWATNSALSVIQQIIINRRLHNEKLERIRNTTGRADGV